VEATSRNDRENQSLNESTKGVTMNRTELVEQCLGKVERKRGTESVLISAYELETLAFYAYYLKVALEMYMKELPDSKWTEYAEAVLTKEEI
jgi:hypothetical protein